MLHFKSVAAFAALLAVGAITPSAQADDIRVGFMFQDINVAGIGGVQGKEKSEGLSLDYVWESPDWLDWMPWDPRPYIGGTVNLSGETNYGGAGLLWQANILDNFYGELAFGLVIHDGEIEIPLPGTAVTAEEALALDRRHASEIEFGSRALFRTEFALGYEVNDNWSFELVYEHLSHGKILSSKSNEGLDSAGIRIARHF